MGFPEQEKSAWHPVFDSPELMQACDSCLMGDRCPYFEKGKPCSFRKENLATIRDEWGHGDAEKMILDTIVELKNVLDTGRVRYKGFPSITIVKGYEALGYLIERYNKVKALSGKDMESELMKELDFMKKGAQVELLKRKLKKEEIKDAKKERPKFEPVRESSAPKKEGRI
jgi:hypothetical protein